MTTTTSIYKSQSIEILKQLNVAIKGKIAPNLLKLENFDLMRDNRENTCLDLFKTLKDSLNRLKSATDEGEINELVRIVNLTWEKLEKK